MKKTVINNNNKEIINNKNVDNNVHEEEYEFCSFNAATGDQYRKFNTLRSESGSITPEQERKFHDDSMKEEREWRKNNPGKSIAFRTSQDESGKQVIKILPTGDLIFASGQRVNIYDENGNRIVGEENIRKEIKRREANWERWEEESELRIVDRETHTTDDGFTASIFTKLPPVNNLLHPNELNDKSTWSIFEGKRGNQLLGIKDNLNSIEETSETSKKNLERGKKRTQLLWIWILIIN